MKRLKKYIFSLLFFIGLVFQANAQFPLWYGGGIGLGLPDGGIHFNSDITHYPGPLFVVYAQTPWNDNWFLLDSLIVGAEFSVSHYNSRDIKLEQNLLLKTLYANFSRVFTLGKVQPFLNAGLGMSTLNTSQKNFVISLGGAVRGGVYFPDGNLSPGISIGYNAPMIAYRNTLTGYWEVTLQLRTFKGFGKSKITSAPSF